MRAQVGNGMGGIIRALPLRLIAHSVAPCGPSRLHTTALALVLLLPLQPHTRQVATEAPRPPTIAVHAREPSFGYPARCRSKKASGREYQEHLEDIGKKHAIKEQGAIQEQE